MSNVFLFKSLSQPSQDISSKAMSTKRAWFNYFQKGIDLGQVRYIIMRSWKRSQRHGINPNNQEAPVVYKGKVIAERINKNKELLHLIRPFMDDLYEIVKGTDSVLAFSDRDGVVLELFGDSEIAVSAASVNFKVGVDMREEVTGTNAIGLAINEKRPIQVFSAEHYCLAWHEANCSSAPIMDPFSNELIGVITLVGYYKSAHPHSLGLITTAANTIMQLIHQQGLEKEKYLLNNYFSAAMDSISDGLVIVNRYGEIVKLNAVAAHLLKVPTTSCYKNVLKEFDYLKPLLRSIQETINGNDIITKKELNIPSKEKFTILFTARRITVNEECLGIILILKKELTSGVREQIAAKYQFSSLIGKSDKFLHTIQLAKKMAKTDKSILISGESGTGKELFAQAIHNASSRKDGPFIAVNCAGIPKELIASELFGYEEGSFTGAVKGGKKGKFEAANGGTIFLDEIGDMPLDLQAHLLRVLEEKEVTPVGSNNPKPLDIRVIAATNKDLFLMAKENKFRLDLFYRLNVLSLTIPPLRERTEDFTQFIEKFLPEKTMSPSLLNEFYKYDWPGNVRELQNVLEHIDVMCEDRVVTAEHLPFYLKEQLIVTKEEMPIHKVFTKKAEKESIIWALRESASVAEAAEKLQVSTSTLYRWIKQHGISVKEELKKE
ncbi:sigma-54-dependent Fis family transcriptional regulator [Pueribacillus theae]|uniref:Sigma-54-dependent Fis family transcriptional regulator n=1 Tax=Pueribacillus theae TaxID=2171751 RepID=A0A2U1K3R6_9BACI|nr:sigma-54-dependent Fis family transcriptional regulator [Pueribacillus theae]PWA11789.1 sigma-54-dependent Fis family transcriptional regulator [Pueribacillus theae]